ncbi:MAG: dienelactone hydrolase family protein [Verrucomicrobia bacterium]|nr:MAG: dienelactone hydrolase family protein [Verrucomicrobiota bacterium]
MNKLIPFLATALVATIPAAAQEWAKARLENSPRHLEWVKVKHGEREVNCSIAYPEVKDKATAVIVIHEIFGLTDWVRSVTDQLAEAGYIAIAPDLLSGSATNGGGTAELGGGDAVRKAISSLKPDQVTADLDAVFEYVSKLPSCNGKVVVAGFCWGGTQTFRYATNNKKLKAAFPFYGTGPEKADEIARIECSVFGFYAGNDNRVTSTVAKSAELMKAAKKTYEPVTYEGAGHGFMRAGEAPDAGEANKKARGEAWQRWKELLKKI